MVSTVDKKKFVDTDDASTTAPLTEDALSSLDGESTFLSTDQLRAQQEAASSGDDVQTQHTKTWDMGCDERTWGATMGHVPLSVGRRNCV